MTVITFDTLAFSKKLQASGMPQEQAEALANAHKETLEEIIEAKELSTKSDILQLESKLSEKIDNNKHEMLKWVIGTTLAQTAIILTIIAFFIK